MSNLQRAADQARDALKGPDDWQHHVAALRNLLAAVDERVAMDELDSMPMPPWFAGSFVDDGMVIIACKATGKHRFDSAIAALAWVKGRDATKC